MTNDDAFQLALENDPSRSDTRLVFADWLEEQGDARAAGYRWMGIHGKWPYDWARSGGELHYHTFDWYRDGGGAIWDVPGHCRLPEWLWKRLRCATDWATYVTRREAEETLCLALVSPA